MSAQLITILVIVAALILLIATRLRPDLVALMVMLALGITGVVDNTHIFSGFSSSAVMTILGISMISVALQQTGVANVLGKMIFKISGRSEILLIFLTALFSATLSLFMNNIAAVGVLLPAVMSLSRRSQTPPGRILIPLAFGTILGGMATLLTTSNIIVSSALKEAGFTGFGLLDYFPVGAPVVAVGLLYLVTIGRKLLPAGNKNDSTNKPMVLSEKLKNLYRLESDLLHLRVLAASPFIGESAFSSSHLKKLNLEIIRVLRRRNRTLTPSPDTLIHEGDILIVRGSVDAQELKTLRLEEVPASKQQVELADNVNPLAELILSPHSDLLGRNLCEIDFRSKYNLNVLGIWREGKPLLKDISTLSLKNGDALLVQGGAEAIHRLEGSQDLLLLEEDPDTVFRPQKLGLTILITLLTLGFAAMDILPVALVVLSGAVLLLLTGCMNLNDAFKRIEWKAIFLIAGMWPLSLAIRDTGLASALINSLLNLLGNVPPLLVAAAFMLLAMLFTQFMSGPVTPIIITPLALAAASNFGIDPHPMAMAVALGCSLAFISPIAHPVNVMVMNPGGYTFKDFFRVGWPLTVLAFMTILAGLHFIWGL